MQEFVSQENVAALEAFERQLLVEASGAGAGAGTGRASSDQHRGAEEGGEGQSRMRLPLRIVSSMMSAQVPSSRGATCNGGTDLAVADRSGDPRDEGRGCLSKRKTRASGARGYDLRQGDSRDVAAAPEILFQIGWASPLRPVLPGTTQSFSQPYSPCFLMSFFRRKQAFRPLGARSCHIRFQPVPA